MRPDELPKPVGKSADLEFSRMRVESSWKRVNRTAAVAVFDGVDSLLGARPVQLGDLGITDEGELAALDQRSDDAVVAVELGGPEHEHPRLTLGHRNRCERIAGVRRASRSLPPVGRRLVGIGPHVGRDIGERAACSDDKLAFDHVVVRRKVGVAQRPDVLLVNCSAFGEVVFGESRHGSRPEVGESAEAPAGVVLGLGIDEAAMAIGRIAAHLAIAEHRVARGADGETLGWTRTCVE
jgi:hypothetical protein